MNEKTLLENIRSGDPAAFKELVERYQDRVMNTCYGFLKNREDAEDTAQEVFIEVYKSIADFREEAKLSTWIYRIAITKSLDLIRWRNRKKRFDRIRNILRSGYEVEQIPASSRANPESNFESQERMRILHQAIDSLPESQKIALTLSKFEGLRNGEIAEIMGTSLSSVEALIHRAKRNLKRKLHSYFEKHL